VRLTNHYPIPLYRSYFRNDFTADLVLPLAKPWHLEQKEANENQDDCVEAIIVWDLKFRPCCRSI
jgi:hypothetical protein